MTVSKSRPFFPCGARRLCTLLIANASRVPVDTEGVGMSFDCGQFSLLMQDEGHASVSTRGRVLCVSAHWAQGVSRLVNRWAGVYNIGRCG